MKKENVVEINNEQEKTGKTPKMKFNFISGNKINHFMSINGYKNDKIGPEIGKGKRTFYNKKKGDTEFTANEIFILTKLFGCTLDDLIKEPYEMTGFEKIKYSNVLKKEQYAVKYIPLETNEELIYTEEINKSKKDKFNIISGKKIKYLLALNEYTVDKIALEFEKDDRSYFNKKNGSTEFTANEIFILTKIFGCTLDDLIKDVKDMTEFERNRYFEVLEKEKYSLKHA